MKRTFIIYLLAGCVLIFTGSVSAESTLLRTVPVEKGEITGEFDLILFGSLAQGIVNNLVILDRRDDGVIIEPYAPEFDYKIIRGLSTGEQIKHAEQFLSFHSAFYRFERSAILGPDGQVLGYEIRPLYQPLTFGVSDVLDVAYRKKGNTVHAYITVKESVERQLMDGDGDSETWE